MMEQIVDREPTFQYTPLDVAGTEIRLIRLSASEDEDIHLRLRHYSLQESDSQIPPYKTLSYMWEQEPANKLIKINGQDFHVRENLYEFLEHIRQPESREWFGADDSFWVDSICINQDDLDERSSQVRLMGQIYASSTNTISWLHRYLSHSVAGNPYWTRLWPCQEIILARDLTVIFDKRLVPHENFKEKKNVENFQVRDIFLWRFYYNGKVEKPYLCQALETFGRQHCSDVKDRLFAILSLISKGSEYLVDYNDNVDTILWRALQHFKGHYSDDFRDDSIRAGLALGKVFGIKKTPRLPAQVGDCLFPVRIHRLERDPSKFFLNCRHTCWCFCQECALIQPLIPLVEGRSCPDSQYLICTAPAIPNVVIIFARGELNAAHLVAVGFIQYANHAGKHRVTVVPPDPNQRPFNTVETPTPGHWPFEENKLAPYDYLCESGACVISVRPQMLHMLLGVAKVNPHSPETGRHIGASWREYTRDLRNPSSGAWSDPGSVSGI